MRKDGAKNVQRRMWYGVTATVTLGPGFIHNAGFGEISIPHPPVINWLLRQGLEEKSRDALSFTHEFGHLQAMPLAVFYTLIMLALAFFAGNTEWTEVVLVLISTHAAWEIASEVVTITDDVPLYRKYYQGVSMVPRIVFWVFTGLLSVTGWFVLLF